MTLLACGINHKTAELSLREQVAINQQSVGKLIASLLECDGIFEVMVLSTCNRTEIYADGDSPGPLLEKLGQHCQVDLEQLQDVSYHYYDQDMVRHVMRLACGLDSMILGEPQIFGQLKSAVSLSEHYHGLGPQLSRLFQQVFHVAKAIRTHSQVGACPVSVASTAVNLAEEQLGDIKENTALLIGAGDTAALTAKHLNKKGVRKIIVASRHLDKAQQLADIIGAEATELRNLNKYLTEADIVFSATASTVPIIGKGMVETALKNRDQRSILMIDIAVPRDIEPEVNQLSAVHLYSIDDLKNIISLNVKSREHAAGKAEEIVIEETKKYMQWLRSLGSVNSIRIFRSWVEKLREVEVAKAFKYLQTGIDPVIVVQRLSNTLSNKLMHPPSVKVREASKEGRTEFIKHFHQLFDLDED